MPDTCSTCKWWSKPARGFEGSEVGECRRNAPLNDHKAGGFIHFWPITQDQDFCGEHTPKDGEDA